MSRADYEGALSAFRQAVHLAPTNGSAWELLARAYDALGRHDAALRAVRRAVGIDRDPDEVVLRSAADLLERGQNEPALRVLDLRADRPHAGLVDYQRAVALNRLGRHDEA